MKTSDQVIKTGSNRIEMLLSHFSNDDVNVGTGERVVSALAGLLLTAYGTLLANGKASKTNRQTWYQVLSLPVGAYLIKRGVTGYCPLNHKLGRNSAELAGSDSAEINVNILVDKPRDQVYKAWRNLGSLPSVFPHIKKVKVLDEGHSEWTLLTPKGTPMARWNALVTKDKPDERIRWTSDKNSDIRSEGEIRFTDRADGKGTEVAVSIHYSASERNAGTKMATFFATKLRNALARESESFASKQHRKQNHEVRQ